LGAAVSSRGRDRSDVADVVPVIRLDPASVEKFLFEELRSVGDVRGVGKVVGVEVEAFVRGVAELSEQLASMFTRSLLGQLVHPLYGRYVFLSRTAIIYSVAVRMLREAIREAYMAAKEGRMRPEELEANIEKIRKISSTIFVAAQEAVNKILNLSFANLPPHYRPSLVNTKLGYDILRRTP